MAVKGVSPAAHFIRTGQLRPGMSPKKAKALGARFLSRVWYKAAMERKSRPDTPLPTFRQRLYGGRLPKADLEKIDSQVDFALNAFNGHLSPAKRAAVKRKVRKYITGRMLSINVALREQTTGNDIKTMRKQGKELYHHLKDYGKIYPALMQDTTGKTYFAPGFSRDKAAATGPIHETVHILQRIGAIKADVPFAQAADRLYALEQGILKPKRQMKKPSIEELDKKPRAMNILPKAGVQDMLEEPGWSYDTGTRIAQWLFLNFPKEQRWAYLKNRCYGASHGESLKRLGKKAA